MSAAVDTPSAGTLEWRCTALAGALLGTALGDAMGLPMEGLSKRRQARIFPGLLRPRFLLGYSMVSDDTEHAFMVGQALLAGGGVVERFQHALAWQFRWWLLALPAGVGFATLRAIGKLWLGISP